MAKNVKRRIVEGISDLAVKYGEPIVDAISDFAVKEGEPILRDIGEALGFAVPRPPRPRQKPKIWVDNPGGKWLEAEQRRARENGYRGAQTARTRKPVMLDPAKIKNIRGANNEVRVPGESQYDRLRPSVEQHGLYEDSPILIGVDQFGEPRIMEGNTRTAVANDLGLPQIPAEIAWYAGGEELPDAMLRPDNIEAFMAQSELMRDPNFRNWFGNSKAVDEYGEPLSVYHGTADTFNAFSNAKIGKGDPGFLGRGFYFGDNPHIADVYSKLRAGPQERVIEAYLALQNPFNWGPKGLGVRGLVGEGARLPESIHDEIVKMTGVSGRVPYEDRPYAERDVALAVRDLLEGKGHDSVIATDDFSDKPIEFVAFKPTQIKSATGNRGTYDPNDPDINKARGGLAVKKRKR